MRVLSRQKNDLKRTLHKLSLSLSTEIDSIQNKMPTPKVPKAISKHETLKPRIEGTFQKRNKIDEELQLIQEKLRELNS